MSNQKLQSYFAVAIGKCRILYSYSSQAVNFKMYLLT